MLIVVSTLVTSRRCGAARAEASDPALCRGARRADGTEHRTTVSAGGRCACRKCHPARSTPWERFDRVPGRGGSGRCDHVNFTEEPWFQEAIVENWRPADGQRKALIPNDWLD